MKKIFKIFLSLFFGSLVFYSILWLSISLFIKNQIIKSIDHMISEKISVIYDRDIKIGGYPNKYQITLSDLKVNVKDGLNNIFDVTSDNLILTFDLLSKNANLAFGKNTISTLIIKENYIKNIYNVNNPPFINVNFVKPVIFKTNPDFKYIWQNFSIISYQDSGFNINSNFVNSNYSISDKLFDYTNIDLKREIKDNKINDNIKLNTSFRESKQSDPVTLLANYSLIFDYNNEAIIDNINAINISKISIQSDKAYFNADGYFEKKNSNSNLVGSLNIDLGNYDVIIDYLNKNLLNVDRLKSLLPKIANADEKSSNIKFTITYDGENNLKIGSMTLSQLIMAYYQL